MTSPVQIIIVWCRKIFPDFQGAALPSFVLVRRQCRVGLRNKRINDCAKKKVWIVNLGEFVLVVSTFLQHLVLLLLTETAVLFLGTNQLCLWYWIILIQLSFFKIIIMTGQGKQVIWSYYHFHCVVCCVCVCADTLIYFLNLSFFGCCFHCLRSN